jgi:hypothetical protein
MRHLIRAIIFASLCSTPALAQKVGQTIDVGGWKITSQANKDGSTGCAATYVYDDKSIISFSLDNDNVHMFIVSEPTAKMKEGSQTSLRYRIDNGRSFSGVGIAASSTLLAVPMADADMDRIYDEFMRGNTLFISLGNDDFEEPLEGSSNAITALSGCQERLPARKK